MEKIKLTEKEVEYLNDFVKMGIKIVRDFIKFPKTNPICW
ncbi:MAG: hypothetical protein AEth_01246 [Candidatus Argoarchaeum ethanivorans]|uniref:Uncharacterized protein n=1 Tax=Candidatus Argoarchaeum ethanivorans TaxID=2608793 RepID=A0A8B3S0J3_9EURY|nr:MAG: hypothetical protein AEth_01246 [Candidatus Argoarchaeum ethanivorans]